MNTGLRDEMGINGRDFVKKHFNCRIITEKFLQQLRDQRDDGV